MTESEADDKHETKAVTSEPQEEFIEPEAVPSQDESANEAPT